MEEKYQPLAMEQAATNLYNGCYFLCQGDQHKFQGRRFRQESERMNFSWNMLKPKGEPLYLSRSIAIVILVFFVWLYITKY
jgi:hypothetical protein